MTTAIDRNTLAFFDNINIDWFPVEQYILDPDLTDVDGYAPIYWKIVGDTVELMSVEERDAVDAVITANEENFKKDMIKSGQIVNDSDLISPELIQYLDDNYVWTDPVSGLKGPSHVIQTLVNRREIFGDAENVLGAYSGALVPRVGNLDTIHGKLGWHNQQMEQALYKRPKDLLVYYGYPNSFNSATNGWNNELVAQEMAKYNLIVLGNGVQDSGHADYANTQIIIPRIKALNPSTKIFGYVTTNQEITPFQTAVDDWDTLGVHGIFLDESGYDFGRTRIEFNTRVDYVHSQTSANLCFANAWNTKHILGTEDDSSYLNTTYNADELESTLTTSDWIMLESFPVNTTAYTASTPDGYETKADWAYRGAVAVTLREEYGVNFAASGVINNNNVDGQELFDFLFVSALQFSLDAVGSSDTSYGSGAAVKWWTRPDTLGMGTLYSLSPSVQVDIGDSDVYWRYVGNGKLGLDFSDEAYASHMIEW